MIQCANTNFQHPHLIKMKVQLLFHLAGIAFGGVSSSPLERRAGGRTQGTCTPQEGGSGFCEISTGNFICDPVIACTAEGNPCFSGNGNACS
ncbi:hypothetical protein F4778DRAFT_710012 [Xylariomycetidae sp. FL2044]|nr:hypothetical protein F4778DRAFT_710012 [Xylariomycetidae sp. FL2044]